MNCWGKSLGGSEREDHHSRRARMPAAVPVPQLRGKARGDDDLATGAVRRVRLRGGYDYDCQAVPRVRLVDRNRHVDGQSPGVRMRRSEVALILTCAALCACAVVGFLLSLSR